MGKKKAGKAKIVQKKIQPAIKTTKSETEELLVEEEPLEVKLENKIKDAFAVFDSEFIMIELRHLPTIVRGLGLCPTENDVKDLTTQILDAQENKEYVLWETCYTFMMDALLNNKYPLSNASTLRRAFRALDSGNKGYLTEEELSKHMSSGKEPLQPDELENMLRSFRNTEDNHLYYKEYLYKMVIDES